MRGYRKPRKRYDIPDAVAERAATKFTVDESGCHISTYSTGSHGYAQVGWSVNDVREDGTKVANTMVTAHRASWVHATGEQIPVGMTIDHLCHVRRCVRFEHLRMVTNVANARDNGRDNWQEPTPSGKECAQGHSILLYATGAQHCRECHNERKVTYRQAAA